MAQIDLSFEHWPVVITTTPSVPVDDAELTAYIDHWASGIAARKGPYVGVIDLSNSAGLAPHQRKTIVGSMNDDAHGILPRCRGTALVFQSAVLRGMLTAMLWVRPPTYPVKIFGSREQALAWRDAS